MIYVILRQNINKHILKNTAKNIHNHSYIILKNELDKKEDNIKKLKERIKELEHKNNSLYITINKLEYQKSIDLMSFSTKFNSKS